jgi:hypothetical protein
MEQWHYQVHVLSLCMRVVLERAELDQAARLAGLAPVIGSGICALAPNLGWLVVSGLRIPEFIQALLQSERVRYVD